MNVVNRNSFLFLWGSEIIFLILVIGVGETLELDDVQMSQVGMAICVGMTVGAYYPTWKLLPSVPPRHQLPSSSLSTTSLMLEGIRQNWRTCKKIQTKYKDGLRWFLVLVLFAEAGTTAMIPISVTFLASEFDYTTSEVGMFFVTALLTSFVGCATSSTLVCWTQNPNVTTRLSLIVMVAFTFAGVFVLTKERRELGFV